MTMFDDSETSSDNPSPFKIKYLQGEYSGENTIGEKKYSDAEFSIGSILSEARRYLTMGKEYQQLLLRILLEKLM